MVSEDPLNKKMEKIYDFLDTGISDLINSRTSFKNINKKGNLLEIRSEDPVYIFPNENIFYICSITGKLDKILKENDNAIILLNQHPGESIFNDISPKLTASAYYIGLENLVSYYDQLKNNEGRLVSLGGLTKAKAIKWFRKAFNKNYLEFTEWLNDIVTKMSAEDTIRELKNLKKEDWKYYSELGRLSQVINEDASKKIMELKLYLTSLPSAVYIEVGGKKILNVPGELPTLVLSKKINLKELRDQTKSPSEKLKILEDIANHTKPLTLDHIVEAKHGSILDTRISEGKNISVKDLYLLEKVYKTLISLPVNYKSQNTILDEKHNLEKEIFKYLLFIPIIQRKNNLDYLIAGSDSVNSFSANDPTKGIHLYKKTSEGIIKLNPQDIEKGKIEIYYPIKDKIKVINLNEQNQKILEKNLEILNNYSHQYSFFKTISEDKLPENIITNGILGFLILDEAKKYILRNNTFR